MSLMDWFRSRRQLVAELVETREQCVEAGRLLADVVEDREHLLNLCEKERAAHAATQRVLEALDADIAGVFQPPLPRTPGHELALMRKHVECLEERLHVLQRANMAADTRR